MNTGDDVTLPGLRISPDVDTVLYALASVVDERQGWGPRDDTFRCMTALEKLGGETWFRLGDVDLATHPRRTELLQAGWSPTAITAELARRLGVDGVTVLPMTDDPVETWVQLARPIGDARRARSTGTLDSQRRRRWLTASAAQITGTAYQVPRWTTSLADRRARASEREGRSGAG